MAIESSEFNAVVKRLEKLEKQNSWLRFSSILTFVFLSAFVLVGLSDSKLKIIEAEKFILKDAHGKSRGSLAISEDGWSSLVLSDSNGKIRAELRVIPKGSPSLRLLNDMGHNLAELGTSGLELHDEEGNFRGRLGLIREDPGSPQQPQLTLCSKDGKPLFQAP